MTIALLAHAYDTSLRPDHLKLFRASPGNYCVQSTVDGQTAFKGGPSAPVALGHC